LIHFFSRLKVCRMSTNNVITANLYFWIAQRDKEILNRILNKYKNQRTSSKSTKVSHIYLSIFSYFVFIAVADDSASGSQDKIWPC
jgi:hypothetical protein